MNIEELKRLAEAVLKAYSGLSWQVTMARNEHGVTHYHIRSHSEPGIAVIKDQYWEDDHIPPVDHYGYIQPDDRMDCDVFRVDIARLIAAANPAAILELIRQIEELRDEVNGLTGSLDRAEAQLKEAREQPPSFWVSADGFRSRGSGRNIATKPEKRKSDDVPLYASTVPAAPAVAVPAVPDQFCDVTELIVPQEWRDVITELADDLSIELDMRYQSRSHYPSELRKYENEMQPVYRARALLQSTGDKK